MNFRTAKTLLCLSGLLATSCSTDFDVTAGWKETMVVYGLINPADPVHYVRVQKAFLGDGNALQMAQVYDSVAYMDGLEVMLTRMDNNTSVKLVPDSSIPKDPGMFANPDQVIFKATGPVAHDAAYKLTVTNTKTGAVAEAVTPVVDNFTIENPQAGPGYVSFANVTKSPYHVKWTSAKEGKIYGLVIRFNYAEIDTTAPTDTTFTYVDWNKGTTTSMNLQGGEPMEMEIPGEQFYQYLATVIPVKPGVKRVIGTLDFIFTVGADDLYTYIEVNKPSTGIVQEKPYYTNVTGNGIGIFSSRFTKTVYNKSLTLQSKEELCSGGYTGNLSFCDQSVGAGSVCECN